MPEHAETEGTCPEFIETGRCGHSDAEHDAIADGHLAEIDACPDCFYGPATGDLIAPCKRHREGADLHVALDDERAAKQVAAEAADRFRDVLSECLGHADKNPGDDVLVSELREHFGKTGPEPTRWRDFCTGALATLYRPGTPSDHPITEYGTTRCPRNGGIAAEIDDEDGSCSSCGERVR